MEDRRSEGQPDYERSIQSLLSWFTRSYAQEVIDPDACIPKTQAFMPIDEVKNYLSENRYQKLREIISVLFPDSDDIIPSDILPNYVAVFCILLQISMGKWMKHFRLYDSLRDNALPFDPHRPPPNWPKNTSDPAFLQKFCDQQWKFCVPVLQRPLSDKHFESSRVLPIIFKQTLSNGGSASLWLIRLHPSYNGLVERDPTATRRHDSANTFVLKTYFTTDARKYYDNEVTAFRRLGHNPNIIGFRGSFTRGDTCNVLLEHADKGTLEDYFKNERAPRNGEEIIQFWEHLFKIIDALRRIHEVEPSTPNGPQIFQGWHQDVKPTNILVVTSDKGLQFKLADLGISHFKRKVSQREDSTASDHYGTRTYGAPECYRPDETTATSKIRVKQNVDIWSLGCIFSEAARWIAHDYKGVLDYRQERRAETGRITSFRDADCFHNGESLLGAVRESHKKSREDLRRRDFITQAIIDQMIMTMLEVSDGRPPAQVIWHTSVRLLQEAREHLDAVNTSSPTKQTPAVDRRLTASSQRPPPPLPPVLPPNMRSGTISNEEPFTSHYDPYPSQDGDVFNNDRSAEATVEYGVHRTNSPGPIADPKVAAEGSTSNRPFSTPNPLAHTPANVSVQEQRMSQPPHSRLQHRPAHNTRGQSHPHESPSYHAPSILPMNQANNSKFGFPQPNSTTVGSPSWLPLTQSGEINAPMSSWATPARPYMVGYTPSIDTSGVNHSSKILHSSPDTDMGTGQPGISSPVSPYEGYFQRPSPGHDLPSSGVSFNHLEESGTPNRDVRNGIQTQHEREQNTKAPLPFLSVGDASDFRRRRKKDHILSKSLSFGNRERISDSNLQERLKGRDHVFLIDNAISMRPHRDGVVTVFESSSYLVKEMDGDGIDLGFTVSDVCESNCKSITRLVQLVEQQRYEGQTDIDHKLNQIFEKYKASLDKPKSLFNKQKPLSLYILTDGVWEEHCNPEATIRSLVKKLVELGKNRQQVGIQFISFGNDPTGLSRLNHLDSGLNLELDIVDTEPSGGNVWKMLLGAIDSTFHSAMDSVDHDSSNGNVIEIPLGSNTDTSAASEVPDHEKESFSVTPSTTVRYPPPVLRTLSLSTIGDESATASYTLDFGDGGGVPESTRPTTVPDDVEETQSIITDGQSLVLPKNIKESLVKNVVTKLWNSIEPPKEQNWELTQASIARVSSALPDLLKEFAQDIACTADVKVQKKAISFIRHYRRQVNLFL